MDDESNPEHDAPGGARVQVQKLREGARLPRYASVGAAGMDLAACVDEPLTLAPGTFARVPTGIAIALPMGTEAQVRPRSGLASRHAVTVLNAPGTIDSDYRGEVQVLLINHGPEPFTILSGERIAQLVVATAPQYELVETESLGATERGSKGFGSTGGFGGTGAP